MKMERPFIWLKDPLKLHLNLNHRLSQIHSLKHLQACLLVLETFSRALWVVKVDQALMETRESTYVSVDNLGLVEHQVCQTWRDFLDRWECHLQEDKGKANSHQTSARLSTTCLVEWASHSLKLLSNHQLNLNSQLSLNQPKLKLHHPDLVQQCSFLTKSSSDLTRSLAK
jgi:hypothetical protein